MNIDTTFDVRTDAGGKDPDRHSATLKRFHRELWSKPLPGGSLFDLQDNVPGAYLVHESNLGRFLLSSDSIVPSFTLWKSMKPIIDTFTEEEIEAFRTIGYTIGGMIIFPAERVDGKLNINGARGFNRKISDRFDLTLECIRRHYLGQPSPLMDTLERYRYFFDLFENFKGYTEFFLLQDLTKDNGSQVNFFTAFDDFQTPSQPQSIEEYLSYRQRSIQFVMDRNRRIKEYTQRV